ncbi:MAG: CDP-alcohol phosphatidyltransferase family protein [Syntrophobacteraceae bacterium]
MSVEGTPKSEAERETETRKFPIQRPIRQAVLNASNGAAWRSVGGIPLVARHLCDMRKLGLEETIIISNENGAGERLKKWQGNLKLRVLQVKEETGSEHVPRLLLSLPDLEPSFLFIDCVHLIDPRILQRLANSRSLTLAYMHSGDASSGKIRAGIFGRTDLQLLAEKGASALGEHANRLVPDDIDPFLPQIRGPLRPYFLEVTTPSEADDATRMLIRCQQKFVMDLPAQYIDPFFENALTYRLCNTPVTPNMVTLFGAFVAIIVAWLFWHGYFVAGAFLTFAVEILDGTDGKLARTKLYYSKLGDHEDVLDYFCETSWYVSLGVGISSAVGGTLPYYLAALLVVSDTIDNVLYTFAGKWHGKSIDLFSPFDASFRRIAGRRNIYGFMFMAGFSMGLILETFAVVAVWAAITAGIHWVRLYRFGRLQARSCIMSGQIQ